MATPMDIGSAAMPHRMRLSTHSLEVLNMKARTRLTIAKAAPLASHFSCWRRSPDERRQLSIWRAMKATDNASRASRIECWTAPNQPAGLSMADRPPAASMRTG